MDNVNNNNNIPYETKIYDAIECNEYRDVVEKYLK